MGSDRTGKLSLRSKGTGGLADAASGFTDSEVRLTFFCTFCATPHLLHGPAASARSNTALQRGLFRASNASSPHRLGTRVLTAPSPQTHRFFLLGSA